jgi:hypothetical protein
MNSEVDRVVSISGRLASSCLVMKRTSWGLLVAILLVGGQRVAETKVRGDEDNRRCNCRSELVLPILRYSQSLRLYLTSRKALFARSSADSLLRGTHVPVPSPFSSAIERRCSESLVVSQTQFVIWTCLLPCKRLDCIAFIQSSSILFLFV